MTTEQTVLQKPAAVNRVASLAKKFDRNQAKELAAEHTMNDYLNIVYGDPRVCRTAYQRMYDMILEAGTEKYTKYRKTITRYKFFDDPEIPIYGLEETLYDLVQVFRGAAGGYGTERRLILLRGPVGSSKSTICALLKKGLERYTQGKTGPLYTFSWKNLDRVVGLYNQATATCPMHDDPLKLLPDNVRKEVVEELNSTNAERYNKAVREAKAANQDIKSIAVPHRVMVPGHLNPRCQYFMDQLMAHHDYDWQKVVDEHIIVHRFSFSEDKRIGIGTFQPKDEKNQDATELTGDINYMALSHYGVDSDPRAFSFDGEFEIANRGMCEFIEILKLAKEFLYDILGATQERKVKPKKFPQIDIDEVLISHTNNPEWEKTLNDRTMEALRDRTIVLNVPYLLEWSKELKILERDYGPAKIKQHIAPHTLEIAALWAICTRLVLAPDGISKVSKVEKAKLYDGRSLPGYTEDTVKELRDRHPGEGLDKGMSARYVQNAVSTALVENERYINPFMVLNILERNLKNCGTITSAQDREDYAKDIVIAKSEYDDIVKNEVQRALVADENAIVGVFANYMDNVYAHMNGTKVKHPYTGDDMDPDERLMRSIEEKIDIHEEAADDFRRSIAGFAGKLAHDKKKFEWDSNPRLKKALELKMFEDTKDTIKLSKLGLGAQVVDPDLQEKIDAIKTRLIRNYGYNEESAKDVLDYVGSIFARGEVQE